MCFNLYDLEIILHYLHAPQTCICFCACPNAATQCAEVLTGWPCCSAPGCPAAPLRLQRRRHGCCLSCGWAESAAPAASGALHLYTGRCRGRCRRAGRVCMPARCPLVCCSPLPARLQIYLFDAGEQARSQQAQLLTACERRVAGVVRLTQAWFSASGSQMTMHAGFRLRRMRLASRASSLGPSPGGSATRSSAARRAALMARS